MAETLRAATEADIIAMCDRLLIEPPSNTLCVDAFQMLQRCRIAIAEANGAISKQAPADGDSK